MCFRLPLSSPCYVHVSSCCSRLLSAATIPGMPASCVICVFFFFLRFVFFLPACLRLLFTLFRTTSTVTMAAAVERGRPSVWPSRTPPPASSPRGPTETLAVSFCQFREGCDGCWWVVVVVALGPLFLDTVLVLIWHCHLSKCLRLLDFTEYFHVFRM